MTVPSNESKIKDRVWHRTRYQLPRLLGLCTICAHPEPDNWACRPCRSKQNSQPARVKRVRSPEAQAKFQTYLAAKARFQFHLDSTRDAAT